MEIGKQIKKFRTEMALSQEDLAEKIFVSRQTISNWENDKNYPDIKSLVLMSSLFSVSLDILIKGDLEEMKEEIKTEEMNKFMRDGTIFGVLLFSVILLPVPLLKLVGYVGIGIWLVIAIVSLWLAIRIEKCKKRFDIQTYREIVAFYEGKKLSEVEKNREFGKRMYQKVLLTIGTGVLTAVVTVTMLYLLF